MMFDNEAAAIEFLRSSRRTFERMKRLAEQAFNQLDDSDLEWTPMPELNSIAITTQHLRGNMISRWTNFLTSDGEKPDRNRDAEFEPPESIQREKMMDLWEEGWACLFHAINSLTPDDLMRTVKIRGEPHTVYDAIHLQISHYAYHVGQMVMLAKMRKGSEWRTLSLPHNQSKAMASGDR